MKKKPRSEFYTYVRKICTRYKFYTIFLFVVSFFAAYFPRVVDLKIAYMIDTIKDQSGPILWPFLSFSFYKIMHHMVYFFGHLISLKYRPKIMEEITRSFYITVSERHLAFFDKGKSGEMTRKILDFQWGFGSFMNGSFCVFKHMSFIAISLYYLFPMHSYSAWLTVFFTAIYLPIMFFLIKKQYRLDKDFSNVRQETSGLMTDSLMNIFRVKIVGSIFYEVSRWIDPALKRWANADRRTRRYHAFYVDLFDTGIVAALFSLQLWIAISCLRRGEISGGDFAFIILSTLQVHREVSDLAEHIAMDVNPSLALMESSFNLIKGQSDKRNMPIALEKEERNENIKGDLVYNNVSCAYQSGKEKFKEALHDISIAIPYGQRVGLVGPSGSGKSTFIKCLLRYFELEKGEVTISGLKINQMKEEDLYRNFSVVPQSPSLFHRTIYENLCAANPDASKQEIEIACVQACVHDEIMQLPEGYHTNAGERGEGISGGQRQRIALACAFLKKGSFFVCDEGTSALDALMQKEVNRSIQQNLDQTGATAIVAAHRLSALEGMDRILVFDQGSIVEDGDHATLIKKEGLYTSLWNSQ